MYVLELEKDKCKCSNHLMRDFIKYMSIIIIIFSIIILLFPNIKSLCKNNILCNIILKFYAIAILIYTVVIIVYYFHIKKQKNCNCSLDWKRHALLYPLFIIPIVIVFLLIFLSILYIFKGSIDKKKFIKLVTKKSKK